MSGSGYDDVLVATPRLETRTSYLLHCINLILPPRRHLSIAPRLEVYKILECHLYRTLLYDGGEREVGLQLDVVLEEAHVAPQARELLQICDGNRSMRNR